VSCSRVASILIIARSDNARYGRSGACLKRSRTGNSMPIGTPFHERTLALCESLNYREWSGYYAVSAYEAHHDHEYNAIRNAAALIDISPLFKYLITGKDATRLVDRVITRDLRKVSVGQVIYTPWCDEHGKVIDDGTVSRLEEDVYRWTAADPSLRWFTQNAFGLNVEIEDISETVAALAVQGPTSGRLLKEIVEDADIENLKYFRVTKGSIAGVAVEVSRTGYTGDLGYEIWMPAEDAVKVWDALIERGRAFDVRPTGMLALDVARIEAGLLLIDIDFNSSKKALVEEQKYSPFEMGLGRLVNLDKSNFVGQAALIAEQKHGPAKQIVGIEIDWPAVEKIYEDVGLPPAVSGIASRVAVPVYSNGNQLGKATSTTWSPTLKKMLALATLKNDFAKPGSRVEIEITVEAVRHRVPATVMKMPFYNPKHKTATPIA
jgi:aminomethyltransferase